MKERLNHALCGAVRKSPDRTGFYPLCLLSLLLLVPMTVRAQLVADGQTNVLDNVATNLTGGVIVGTNGTFTLLVITNGATVTNSSGNSVVGYNASAQSNRVVVALAGSVWNNNGNISVGQSGSASELDILDGGLVTDAGGYIGQTSASSNNLVVVSGTNSLWTNSSSLYVGYSGSGNALIITNGGKVSSGNGINYVGENSTQNSVLITGSSSSWNCSGYFYLSYINGGRSQIAIKNGGAFTTSSTFDIGVYANSNSCMVADASSSLQCQTFRIGYASIANQCIVTNGATLAVNSSSQPTTIEGTFTIATVTGAGSVWTNAGDLDFGQYSNVLSITSGGMVVDNNGYIENGSGKPNTVIVAGTNSLWKNLGDLHVADLGAQLLITNGGTVANNYGYLGDNAGNNNCYVLVSGPGSVWTNRYDLYIGNNGATNQLVVANSGAVVARQNLYVGYNGNGNQIVVSNSGLVTVANQLQISSGTANSNTVTVNGGTMVVTNGASLNNGGTLVLNSGLFKANSLFDNSLSGRVIFNGGTLQSGGTSYYFRYAGNAAPFVVGDGAEAATFQLLNSGTHSFAGGLVVSSNALLTGAGTVNGNIFVGNGGTFAPGTTDASYLTVNGGLVLSNSCTTLLGLNPASGYTNHVEGLTNVVYGGTLQITDLASQAPFAPGQSFKLFYANNYSGAFNNLLPATPGPGLRWDTYELNIDGVLRVFRTNTPTPAILGTVQTTAIWWSTLPQASLTIRVISSPQPTSPHPCPAGPVWPRIILM